MKNIIPQPIVKEIILKIYPLDTIDHDLDYIISKHTKNDDIRFIQLIRHCFIWNDFFEYNRTENKIDYYRLTIKGVEYIKTNNPDYKQTFLYH